MTIGSRKHITLSKAREVAHDALGAARFGKDAATEKIEARKAETFTAVYDRHSYDLEKRSALDFWGRRLEAVIANKRGAKVLTFEARR